MDCRFHLCLDGSGLALCGRRRRSVLAPGSRLVDERSDDGAARHRCPGDGDLATRHALLYHSDHGSQTPVNSSRG
jgi:hypothetical protein